MLLGTDERSNDGIRGVQATDVKITTVVDDGIFGEISIVYGSTRVCSAIAVDATFCAFINKSDIAEVASEWPILTDMLQFEADATLELVEQRR